MEKKKKSVFKDGAISSEFIGNAIYKHQVKTNIGAHSIFLGQVRADEIEGKEVKAIEYSCYEELANNKLHEIREEAFEKFDLTCMHIYHSTGKVKAGEICLFVFTSSVHRAEAQKASDWLVESIKSNVPIFGKELFEDETYVWKENK